MNLIETERLTLRELTLDDAAFTLELLNEPAYKRYIADRGIHNLAGARDYLENGPLASYVRFGFGLWRVGLKESDEPMGMCGLIQRNVLPDVDIGYALLERFWGQGYAYEAASAVLSYGHNNLNIKRIVAITAPDNVASCRLLEKLGLTFAKIIDLPTMGGESRLYVPSKDR